jgi:putative FmdB family regulatory protein
MTYAQKCEKCKHEFEVERSIIDAEPVPCPKCATAMTQRLITGGTGFILEGDRWAKDGYSDKKENKST